MAVEQVPRAVVWYKVNSVANPIFLDNIQRISAHKVIPEITKQQNISNKLRKTFKLCCEYLHLVSAKFVSANFVSARTTTPKTNFARVRYRNSKSSKFS